MINVSSSRDVRSKVQNGFWGFKLIILSGLVAGAFFIPNNGFAQALMIVGLIGGFLVSVNRCPSNVHHELVCIVHSGSIASLD